MRAVTPISSTGLPAPRSGPNEEIRVACVGIHGQGMGHIGMHVHAKNVRVVTLCDIDERLFPGAAARTLVLDGPALAISGSGIRARVAAGRSIRYLVPDPVIAYIADHHLYASPRREHQP